MASWKEFYKAELITAEKLAKGPLTLVIEDVNPETMKKPNGEEETKLQLKFVGDEKELRLNVTNARLMGKAFGEEIKDWVGKKIRLVQCNTEFNGKAAKGVRIEPVKK